MKITFRFGAESPLEVYPSLFAVKVSNCLGRRRFNPLLCLLFHPTNTLRVLSLYYIHDSNSFINMSLPFATLTHIRDFRKSDKRFDDLFYALPSTRSATQSLGKIFNSWTLSSSQRNV